MKRSLGCLPAAIAVVLLIGVGAQPCAAQLLTITNPLVRTFGGFGGAVAALGTDRIIIGDPESGIGARGAGTAYLFNTNGDLLVNFTNPAPQVGQGWGASLAAVGEDRVLIGAWNGPAHLFRQDGVWLATFTNGSNNMRGGVAALGTDRLLIGGAHDQNPRAYLFDTNGLILTTFTNPTANPGNSSFGETVCVLGSDIIVVGAFEEEPAVVHLFNTNGVWLRTLSNQVSGASGGFFGAYLAAVGTDRLLVGAPNTELGARAAGAVFLYHVNGTLLTTFTNPFPQVGDAFGAVAPVNGKYIVIGARRVDGAESDVGKAYLFATNGVLLNSYTNPTPGPYDEFGRAVAGLGGDRILIGEIGNVTPGRSFGAVHLYDIFPRPVLDLTSVSNANLLIRWETPEPGLILQQSDLLAPQPAWVDAGEPVTTNGPTNVVQQAISGGMNQRFYRLRRPPE